MTYLHLIGCIMMMTGFGLVGWNIEKFWILIIIIGLIQLGNFFYYHK